MLIISLVEQFKLRTAYLRGYGGFASLTGYRHNSCRIYAVQELFVTPAVNAPFWPSAGAEPPGAKDRSGQILLKVRQESLEGGEVM